MAQDGQAVEKYQQQSAYVKVLEKAQNKKVVDNNKLRQLLKGRVKHEEKNRK